MEEKSPEAITPVPLEAVADAMQAAAEKAEDTSDTAPEARATVTPPPGQLEAKSPEAIVQTPLEAVADAMEAAAEKAEETSDTTPEARPAPPPGQLVSKTVYASSYYLSFGVVFGALMVARIVPTDNALGAGLRDGAAAAKDVVQQRAARRAARRASQATEDMNALIDSLPEEDVTPA